MEVMQHALQHAPVGGTVAMNHRYYKGGEFVPFYVPRIDMPQIDVPQIPALLEYLDELGVKVARGFIDPMVLRPHQHINVGRVDSLTPVMLATPCLISGDNFILDGHHRWFGHIRNQTQLPFIRIHATFEDAVEMLLSFPGTREEAL